MYMLLPPPLSLCHLATLPPQAAEGRTHPGGALAPAGAAAAVESMEEDEESGSSSTSPALIRATAALLMTVFAAGSRLPLPASEGTPLLAVCARTAEGAWPVEGE